MKQRQLDLQIILMATTGYDNKRDTPREVQRSQGQELEEEGAQEAGAIGRPYKKFVLPAVIWPGCSYASPIWQSSPKAKTIAKLTWLSLSLPSLHRLLLLLLLAACCVATAVHLWHAMQMQPAPHTLLTCPASCSRELQPPVSCLNFARTLSLPALLKFYNNF